jgi:hypothetical protein
VVALAIVVADLLDGLAVVGHVQGLEVDHICPGKHPGAMAVVAVDCEEGYSFVAADCLQVAVVEAVVDHSASVAADY